MHRYLRIALLVVMMSNALAAQVPDEDRLNELARKIETQQKQIDALQQAQAELMAQLKEARGGQSIAASTSGPPSADRPGIGQSHQPELPSETRASQYADWRHGGDGGLNLGDKVKIGGYGSFRFETNDVTSGNDIAGGSGAGFTFRRFVVTTDARPAKRLRVYSELEYERFHGIGVEKKARLRNSGVGFEQTTEGNPGGEIALEQAWAQFNFAEKHGLRGGIVLPPVGRFNILHDDDYWDVPRRTLVDRDAPVLPVKSAWRDLGAGIVGSFDVGAKGKLDYQVYALNGAALDFNIEHEAEIAPGAPGTAAAVFKSDIALASGFFDGRKSTSAFAWRAAYSPALNGEFAFSGYHGKYAPNWSSFREPITSLAFDHKWRWKGFETEGEFVYTTMGNLDRALSSLGSSIFNSANEQLATRGGGGLTKVEVETAFSNLAKTRYGFWNDFKYHARPKWLRDSFLGKSFEDPQIIPVVRYERVWLNNALSDIEISGGTVTNLFRQYLEQDRVTLGASYRPTLQFAIQAAFEHNRRLSGDHLIYPQVDQKSTNGLLVGMSFAF